MIPGVGSVNIKSQFARLKPKYERKTVENAEFELLSAKLYDWYHSNFPVTGQEEYFKEISDVTVAWTIYIDPLTELHSDEMDLSIKMIGWLWYLDDALDKAIEANTVPVQILKQASHKILSILSSEYESGEFDAEKDVVGFPEFRPLFNSLLTWHNICKTVVPRYEKRVVPFRNCFSNWC